jgi:threonine dehydrogenase-like Zn-dependent dehydrogenase
VDHGERLSKDVGRGHALDRDRRRPPAGDRGAPSARPRGIALEALELPAPAIVFKEAELVGALVYRRTECAAAIELLAEGRIPTEGLISDVVPLEGAEAMFQALTAPANERMKVLLKP